MERVSDLSARVTKLRCGGQQGITHWDDSGRCNGLLEPLSALISPACDKGAVAKLNDGDSCEKDLLAGHESDLWLEAGRRRRLMDALKTPVSTRILTTRKLQRKRRPRPRTLLDQQGVDRVEHRSRVKLIVGQVSGQQRSPVRGLARGSEGVTHDRQRTPSSLGQPPATKATTT